MAETGGLPSATIIVCTRDRRAELESCLDALARQTVPSFETLVVDNGTSPPVADVCALHGARYALEPAVGLCVARNTGVRLAAGDIVAFIDDDAVPDPAWLETLLGGFRDPSIAAVTGEIRYVKTPHHSRPLSENDAGASVPRPRAVFDRHSSNWFAQACFGGIGDGSNMAFRRQMLLDSPGFDSRLGRGRLLEGGDESLVFMTLLALGHRIAHVPESVVRHPWPGDPAALGARAIRERRNSIAYLMFLWTEFPTKRRDIARHLIGAATRRLTRRRTSEGTALLTVRSSLQAAVEGLVLFTKARREWTTIPAPDYRRITDAVQ